MDEKQMRKGLRINIGSYGWALVIYFGLMTACVNAAVMVDMIFRMMAGFAAGGFSGEALLDEAAILGNGWGYLAACMLAVGLIRLWKGKDFFRGMWKTEREMKPAAFWQLLCVFISGQLLFQILAAILESVLNLFGLSVLEAMEMASVSNDTVSMFLYTVLAAPVVEEIIFRGLVLRGLERYGKKFAIVASALLFGAFHGNIVQSPYAFAVGLVLGYTAVEYNIGWAMVLHMANNLVLGDTLPRLTQGLGEMGYALLTQWVIIVCTVAAVVILIRKRKLLGAFLRRERENRPCWRAFWTAPGNIVLFIVMGLSAVSMLMG